MKRRSCDPSRRSAPSGSLIVICALFAVGGCAHRAPPPANPRASAPVIAHPSPSFESRAPAASSAQRRAQQAWCTYLETLYLRSTPSGAPWDQREACNAYATTAAPEMLERTATCSRHALEGVTGDPFTSEYAAAVRRCGAEAIESLTLKPSQVDPYVALVCERAEACGAADPSCRADTSTYLGEKLGRAVGILNEEGRIELRQCLRQAACAGAGEQIVSCLEPILARLIWTPD